MNIESGLISKIKTKEDVLLILGSRIKKNFFEEHGDIFESILDHYTRYQNAPEQETLKQAFPNFEFSESEEPLEYFLDAIRQSYTKKLLKQGIADIVKDIDDDPYEAKRRLQKLVITSNTDVQSGVDVDVRDNVDSVKTAYQKKKEFAGVDGYSTGWSWLDEATCGYHGGELVVIVAKPKMCKTWLLINSGRHVWREEEVPVVMMTKEMSQQAIINRLYALECGLPYKDLRKGMLSPEQERRYFAYLDRLETEKAEGKPGFHIKGYDLSDTISGVSSLIPSVEQYLLGGGLLVVDGIYLIPDDKGETDWRAMVNVATALKNLAQKYNIPILASTQHEMADKSDKPRIDGVAYGKYLAQFVDGMVGIERTEEDRKADIGRLHLLAHREAELGEFVVNMNFNPLDFSQRNIKTIEEAWDDDSDEEVQI